MPRGSTARCEKCAVEFIDGRGLDIHLRRVHADVRPFMCHLCPVKFETPAELEEHVETCTGPPGTNTTNSTNITTINNVITNSTNTNNIAKTVNMANSSNIIKSTTITKTVSSPNFSVLQTQKCPIITTSTSTLVGQLMSQAKTTTTTSAPSIVRVVSNGDLNNLPFQGQKMVVPKEMLDSILKNPGLLKTLSLPKLGAPQSTSQPQITGRKNTVANLLKSKGNVKVGQIPAMPIRPKIVTANGTLVDNLSGMKVIPVHNTNLTSINKVAKTEPVPVVNTTITTPASLTALPPENAGGATENLRPFACNCERKCSSLSELKTHIEAVHKGDDDNLSISCFLCVMTFSKITELEEHVKSFVCPVDEAGKWKGFGSMPSVPPGAFNILDPKLDTAEGSLSSLPSVSDLPGLKFERKASSVLQQETTKIDKKDIVFTESDEEQDPGAAITNQRGRRHQCNVCHKSYSNLDDFTRHYRKHVHKAPVLPVPITDASQQEKRYPCNVCSKSFSTFENLFIHSKVHTGETPYPCRFCDMAFVDEGGLRYHLTGVHRMQMAKLLQCRVIQKYSNTKYGERYRRCHGKYLSIKDLREHGIIHHQGCAEIPCGCQRCGEHFERVDQLQEHIDTTTQCDIKEKLNEWIGNSTAPVEYQHIIPATAIPNYGRETKGLIDQSLNYRTIRIRNSTTSHGRKRILKVVLDRKTRCPRCRVRFAPLERLRDHYNTRCDAKRIKDGKDFRSELVRKVKYDCTICNLVFWERGYYDNHMLSHQNADSRKEFQEGKTCNLCMKVFYDMTSFFEHWKTHGGYHNKRKRHFMYPDSVPAKERNKTTSQLDDDVVIETTSTSAMTPLEVQSEPENENESVKKPKLIWKPADKPSQPETSQSDSRTLKFSKSCCICERVFTDMNTFIEHYRSHENGDERSKKRYSCHTCSSTFISRQVYLNHMKIHSGETPYTCKFCNEAFKSETDLGLHIPAAHLKTKFFRLTDYNQGRTFAIKQVTSVYEMKLTMGTKAQRWSCKCLECDRTYTTFKMLKTHILSDDCAVKLRPVILEERNSASSRFLCKICGNLYFDVSGLESHLTSVHTVPGNSKQ